MVIANFVRRVILGTSILIPGAALALVGGCSHLPSRAEARTWTMNTGQGVPAASGEVKIVKEQGNNTTIQVGVQHLAKAQAAFNGAETYVVWIKPEEGGSPQNEGELRLGDDLKGSLRAETAFRRFEVFVTAEQRPNVTTPSDNRVLDTTVSLPG